MKKVTLLIILLISSICISGCSKKDKMKEDRIVPTSEELCGIVETSSDMDMALEKGLNTNKTRVLFRYIR